MAITSATDAAGINATLLNSANQVVKKAPAPGHSPGTPKAEVFYQTPVDGLLADWGKSGSPHDLDGSGTVDVMDLLSMLGKMSTPAPDPARDGNWVARNDPSVEPGGTVDPPKELPTLEVLLAQWGQESSDDLDGDGTIGVGDLLTLLNQLPPGQVRQEVGASVRGVLESWGRIGGNNDVNLDGTVNVQDLLQLLGRISDGNGHESAQRPDTPVAPKVRALQRRAAAEHAARSIWHQAGASRFSELRDRIEGSNLAGSQKQMIMNRIGLWVPRGENLSVVG